MKEKKKMKKSVKITLISIGSVLLTLILAAAIIFSTFYLPIIKANDLRYNYTPFETKEEVYEYFDAEAQKVLEYDMSQYADEVEDAEESFSDFVEGVVENDAQSAKELSAEYQKIVDEANDTIVEFFEKEHGVSVKDRISKLKVKAFACSNENIGGFYCTEADVEDLKKEGINHIDSSSVYISDIHLTPDMLSDDKVVSEIDIANFYGIYIHEAIHYLGMSYYEAYGDLIEGVTEALTEDVFLYGGYEYCEDNTMYIANKALGEQVMIADKTFVKDFIENNNKNLDAFIKERIDSKTLNGMADEIDDALLLLMNYADEKEYRVISQDLIGEYCKHFELTDDEQVEIANEFIVALSDFANN